MILEKKKKKRLARKLAQWMQVKQYESWSENVLPWGQPSLSLGEVCMLAQAEGESQVRSTVEGENLVWWSKIDGHLVPIDHWGQIV